MGDWLIPYLTFSGNCEEAVRFYEKALGGEVSIMRYGDAPPDLSFPVPDSLKNLVLHAELRKDGHVIGFSDTTPGEPQAAGDIISFGLEFRDEAELRAAFAKLSSGGEVDMELQKTFFSPLYGKVVDKFGIQWQLRMLP